MRHFGEKIGKRILWIDFAKSIGIWLVIIGHMEIPAHMEKFIFAFHMPLFFFISGYLEKNSGNIKETILNGIKTLLIPYMLLYGLFYLYWLVIVFLRHPEIYRNQSLVETLGKPIMGMLLGIGRNTRYSRMINVPLWFLMGLFFTKTIHKIIVRVVKNRTDYYILGIGIVIWVMFILRFIGKPILFSVDCAVLAFPFFGIGNIIRKTGIIKLLECHNIKKIIINIIIAAMGFVVIMIAVKYNGKADVNHFIYGRDSLLFYMLGIIGIISIISISMIYKQELKIITIISNGTIIILAGHNLINQYLYKITNIINIETNIGIIIVQSLINIGITIIPIVMIQKNIPILVGGRK
jgi:fucose 4-O-acetylase-like acetyltransferase